MSLIKDIEDVRNHVAIDAGSTLNNLQPDIDEVEQDYIIPALGQATYDALNSAYNADTPNLDEDETKLLNFCQVALVNLAQAKYIVVNRVNFSNSGIRIIESGEYKTAYKYMFDELIQHFEKRGFNYIDKALAFLESKKDVFVDWAGDEDAYTVNKRHFIQTADQFDKHYRIGKSRRTFIALEPIMQSVEDFFIENTLTVDLSARIKAEILTGNELSESTQDLIDKIQPALAHLTIGHAIDTFSFEVTELGLLIREFVDPNQKRSSPSDSRLEMKRNAALTTGHRYVERLKDFLNASASASVYPEYFNSGQYVAPGGTSSGRDQQNTKFYVA